MDVHVTQHTTTPRLSQVAAMGTSAAILLECLVRPGIGVVGIHTPEIPFRFDCISHTSLADCKIRRTRLFANSPCLEADNTRWLFLFEVGAPSQIGLTSH